MAPIIPVAMTNTAVSGGFPLIMVASSMAIGAVTDLMLIEARMFSDSAKTFATIIAAKNIDREPMMRPTNAGNA
jgi:hypothetical protein